MIHVKKNLIVKKFYFKKYLISDVILICTFKKTKKMVNKNLNL